MNIFLNMKCQDSIPQIRKYGRAPSSDDLRRIWNVSVFNGTVLEVVNAPEKLKQMFIKHEAGLLAVTQNGQTFPLRSHCVKGNGHRYSFVLQVPSHVISTQIQIMLPGTTTTASYQFYSSKDVQNILHQLSENESTFWETYHDIESMMQDVPS